MIQLCDLSLVLCIEGQVPQDHGRVVFMLPSIYLYLGISIRIGIGISRLLQRATAMASRYLFTYARTLG